MRIVLVCLLALNVHAFKFQEVPKVLKRNDAAVGSQNNVIYSFNQAIGEAKQSVVNISTQKRVNQSQDPIFSDPLFKQFFGDLYSQVPKDKIERSLGSGVIISSDGYIVTNNHVIDGADKILVSLSGASSKEYEAKVIGKDPRSDLAVIKINHSNLPSIKIADSNDLLVGDIVFAIGNPFGVGESVTQGIVSALDKSGIGLNDYENFIQTDASINPGNSGGALVDTRGALIGINTAILSRTGGNHGIGFAIPSDMVKRITKTLIEKGSVERGYLGVGIQDVTEKLSNLYNDKRGAVLVSVEENGAAAKAGLKIWDLIIGINNHVIKSASDLKNIIGTFLPNDEIKVRYIRNKKEYVTTVRLNKSDDVAALADLAKDYIDGMNVENLDKKRRDALQIPAKVNGVIVTKVERGSKAENYGFEEGDIIAQVEDVVIKDVQTFKSAMDKNKNNYKRILVYSRFGAKTLVVK